MSMTQDRTFVTGFGPFGAVTENPSSFLAENSGRQFQVLDVSYRAVNDFINELRSDSFDRLVMLGVAVSRDRLTPELFARNMIGRAKDVRGFAQEGYIATGEPLLLESTLWTPELISEIAITVPHTKVSMDAGSYLCNYLSYRAMVRFPNKAVGFLHVPSPAKLALDVQEQSLRMVLEMIEQDCPVVLPRELAAAARS